MSNDMRDILLSLSAAIEKLNSASGASGVVGHLDKGPVGSVLDVNNKLGAFVDALGSAVKVVANFGTTVQNAVEMVTSMNLGQKQEALQERPLSKVSQMAADYAAQGVPLDTAQLHEQFKIEQQLELRKYKAQRKVQETFETGGFTSGIISDLTGLDTTKAFREAETYLQDFSISRKAEAQREQRIQDAIQKEKIYQNRVTSEGGKVGF